MWIAKDGPEMEEEAESRQLVVCLAVFLEDAYVFGTG